MDNVTLSSSYALVGRINLPQLPSGLGTQWAWRELPAPPVPPTLVAQRCFQGLFRHWNVSSVFSQCKLLPVWLGMFLPPLHIPASLPSQLRIPCPTRVQLWAGRGESCAPGSLPAALTGTNQPFSMVHFHCCLKAGINPPFLH